VRIKRHDDERLVTTHFPIVMAILSLIPAYVAVYLTYLYATGQIPTTNGQPGWGLPLFAAILALVWLVIPSWFVRKLTFDFDLVQKELRWYQWSLWGKKSGAIPFREIRHATLDESYSDSGLMFRPVLLTLDGRFPLLNYSTNGFFTRRRFERIVVAINAALGRSAPRDAKDDLDVTAEEGRLARTVHMTLGNWVFGIWGIANVAAAVALHLWELRWGRWPHLPMTIVLWIAGISIFITLFQTVMVFNKLDLNSPRRDSREHRDRVTRRWKQVFFHLPVASSVMILLFIQSFVLLLANGTGLSAKMTGETHVNRLLITSSAMLFSAVPVYANLFLVPKWRSMFGQSPTVLSRERPMAKGGGR
jgi:hypothetical protein